MTLIIIIFFIAIIGAFSMLLFRAWEIRTSKIDTSNINAEHLPKLSFRYIEKIILYLTKHIIQWLVLSSVKLWYTTTTKTKSLIQNKLPKINNFLKKKARTNSRKISFVERSVIESKIKIKKVKEKIMKEYKKDLDEDKPENIPVEVDKII